MKKIAALIVISGCLITSLSAQVLISNFGANIVSGDLTGSWIGNYNSGTSTISANDGPGSGIQDFTGPAIGNVSGLPLLRLVANVATNPATNFSIRLYDADGDFVVAAYNWTSFVGGATVDSALSVNGLFNPATVSGWELVAGGLGSGLGVTFTNLSAVTAVPEPSAVAMMIVGLAGLWLVAHRRRTVA